MYVIVHSFNLIVCVCVCVCVCVSSFTASGSATGGSVPASKPQPKRHVKIQRSMLCSLPPPLHLFLPPSLRSLPPLSAPYLPSLSPEMRTPHYSGHLNLAQWCPD